MQYNRMTAVRENPKYRNLPVEECDVLIIGSGPVGATYAREILNPASGALPETETPKVIMVETGAQESKVPGEHKKNAVVYQKHIDSFVNLFATSVPTRLDANLKLPPVSWSPRGEQNFNGQNKEQNIYHNLDANGVSRNVGGMSTHWTCATPRQHKLERSDVFDDATWNKLYHRAEELIGTRTDVLKQSIRQRLVLDILQERFRNRDAKALPLAAQKVEGKNLIKWSSSSTVLGDLIQDDKLILLDQHLCEKLEFKTEKDGTNKVSSAIIKDLAKPQKCKKDEDRLRIKAKYVVVCGGPILTPQLLFKSGFRYDEEDAEDAEGNKSFLYIPALGRNLTEQTMCFCQIVLKDKWVERLQKENWGSECEEHRRKFDEIDDPLRIPFDDLDPQITLPFTEKTPWHTQIHRDAFSYGAAPPAIDKRTIVDLRYFGRVETQWRNRVTFSKKLTDAYGMPQPTFDFTLSTKDRLEAHRMMQDMEKVAGELGGYLPGSEPQFLAPGLALHVCGTTAALRKDCRSEDEMKRVSVCNENSKVWGIENLHLGGLNVIPGPRSNASNPTLTAMCFAIKGAEEIRLKLGSKERSDGNNSGDGDTDTDDDS
ncbi:pyranose 2-oxidase [Aspergillus nidulans var. acristatus]